MKGFGTSRTPICSYGLQTCSSVRAQSHKVGRVKLRKKTSGGLNGEDKKKTFKILFFSPFISRLRNTEHLN